MIYYLFTFIALIITVAAEILVQSRYAKFKKVKTENKMSGFEVARKILDDNGLSEIYIVETKGTSTDHYDPNSKVIRLSHDIYHGETVSAMAVAAHECGHAIQYKEGNKFIKIRSFIFPVVRFCSYASYFVILISLLAGMLDLLYLGIGMLIVILLFQLLTLPVEFDASSKALKEIERLSLSRSDEKEGAKKVLTAAALTYVASLATAILEILRLLLIASDRD